MARERSRRGCIWPLLGCGGVLLVILVVICALGGYAYRAWQQPPQQWSDTQARLAAMPADQRRQLAIALENRLSRELSFADPHVQAMLDNAAGGAETRILRLDTDEINAWLADRFPVWAQNQRAGLPRELSNFRYWVDDAGRPVLAAEVQTAGYTQVVSITFDPQLQPDGRMTAPISALRGGQLALPLSRLTDQVRGYLTTPDQQAQLTQALAVLADGEPFDPVVPLRDGRRVRLTALAFTPEHVELTLRIDPAP